MKLKLALLFLFAGLLHADSYDLFPIGYWPFCQAGWASPFCDGAGPSYGVFVHDADDSTIGFIWSVEARDGDGNPVSFSGFQPKETEYTCIQLLNVGFLSDAAVKVVILKWGQ